MRTQMQAEYEPIVLRLHPAQLEALGAIKRQTGKDRTSLIREAIAMLIGSYVLAEKEREDVKVA